MSDSVYSRGSRGNNAVRDDLSTNDTVSIASSDEFLLSETGEIIRSDRFHKQQRRGSGLGSLANYFKSNIRKVMTKEHGDGVPSQVSLDGVSKVDQPQQQPEHGLRVDKSKEKTISTAERSPQQFLDVMWRARGYSRELFSTLETAYHNSPSALQVASHHNRLVEMVRADEIEELRSLMKLGISQNPSNENGESLIHEVCRLGKHELLDMLLSEFSADVLISDNSGRTPLHEACLGGPNEPHFGVVDILAAKDARMFSLKDQDGKTPLDCVPFMQWGAWIDFLYVRRDMYWPRRLVRVDGEEPPPPLVLEKPHSRPSSDPASALTIDLAGLLVSGEITPEEAKAQNVEAAPTDDSSTTTS